MQFIEIIKQAISSLRINMLRSSLTLLAIAVGVFAIISANTSVLVLDTFFKETLNLMGGNVITVTRTPAIQLGGDNSAFRNRQPITLAQMEELEEMADMASRIGPATSFAQAAVSYGGESTEPNVSIDGANEFFLSNNAFDIAQGRNFLAEDIDYARPLVILGADVANTLFEFREPLDEVIRVNGRPYTVIGVAEERGEIFGQSLDNFVLLPYTTLTAIYGSQRNITFQVQAAGVEQIEAVMDEVIGLFRVIRDVSPEAVNDFELSTNESLSDVFEQFTGILYLIGFIVGGIALLGAGIGVMNIMLVSVTERTREIGIRKTVGATRKAITYQFLMESIMICQIGGVIGILFGALVGNVAAILLESSIVFPWSAAFQGVIGMTLIGTAFGVYPAFKAAQLDPVESLRYE